AERSLSSGAESKASERQNADIANAATAYTQSLLAAHCNSLESAERGLRAGDLGDARTGVCRDALRVPHNSPQIGRSECYHRLHPEDRLTASKITLNDSLKGAYTLVLNALQQEQMIIRTSRLVDTGRSSVILSGSS
ncbi:MAG: hypothetical protein SNJ67_13560, partial [Chloracidobacterium sp.]